MRRKLLRNRKKSSIGRVVIGALLGGVVAATARWLIASVSGDETRRRLNERIKTSEGNIESQVRELAAEGSNPRNAF